MSVIVVYLFLLSINCLDCWKLFFKFYGDFLYLRKHFLNATDVSFEITELLANIALRVCFALDLRLRA